MNEVLLGVLSALVGSFIFVMKWLITRSDKNLERCHESTERRDKHIEQLIQVSTEAIHQLKTAMGSFQRFEKEEEAVHMEILNRLDKHDDLLNGMATAQARTVELLGRMLKFFPQRP